MRPSRKPLAGVTCRASWAPPRHLSPGVQSRRRGLDRTTGAARLTPRSPSLRPSGRASAWWIRRRYSVFLVVSSAHTTRRSSRGGLQWSAPGRGAQRAPPFNGLAYGTSGRHGAGSRAGAHPGSSVLLCRNALPSVVPGAGLMAAYGGALHGPPCGRRSCPPAVATPGVLARGRKGPPLGLPSRRAYQARSRRRAGSPARGVVDPRHPMHQGSLPVLTAYVHVPDPVCHRRGSPPVGCPTRPPLLRVGHLPPRPFQPQHFQGDHRGQAYLTCPPQLAPAPGATALSPVPAARTNPTKTTLPHPSRTCQ